MHREHRKCPKPNFICKYCGKTARNEEARNCQINTVHNISCAEELCNIKFTNVEELGTHLKTHLSPWPVRKRKAVQVEVEVNNDSLDLDDSVADKDYIPQNTDENADEDDNDDLEYKCNYCTMSFDWESLLKKHIDSQHAIEMKKKPRLVFPLIDIAKLVEKALPSSTSNTSTKLCKECDKTFAQGWNLSRHK